MKLFLAFLGGICLVTLSLWMLPPAAANPLTGAASISAGDFHTCVVTDVGGVKCWGAGGWGQVADGTNGDMSPMNGDITFPQNIKLTPVDACADQGCQELLSNIAAVSAGGSHTCALTTGGGVKCWGANDRGQLGVEGAYCYGFTGQPFPCSNTPVDVPGLESGVAGISAGEQYTCAVMQDGGVKCWGDNGRGQLGTGTAEQCGGLNPPCPPPTNVCQDFDAVAQRCIQSLSGVAGVSAGWSHTCVLTTGGGVKCWGSNGGGALGDGTTESRLTPVDVTGMRSKVRAIAVGAVSCAVTDDGGAKCWGGNAGGGLGIGTVDDEAHPVPEQVCQSYDPTARQCLQLLSGAVAVTVGVDHTCALTSEHRATCWGNGRNGQLGDGEAKPTPLNVHPTPVNVVNFSNAAAVDAGFGFGCALTQVGGAKCWGAVMFSYTSLGDGRSAGSTTPVDVVAATAKTATPTPVVTPSPSATPPGCQPRVGDADGDCAVNSRDALLILQLDAGMILSLPEPRNADVNGNDVINSIDAQLILQFSAGLTGLP